MFCLLSVKSCANIPIDRYEITQSAFHPVILTSEDSISDRSCELINTFRELAGSFGIVADFWHPRYPRFSLPYRKMEESVQALEKRAEH